MLHHHPSMMNLGKKISLAPCLCTLLDGVSHVLPRSLLFSSSPPFLPPAHANFEPEKSQNGIVTGARGSQQLLLLINSSHNRCMLHT